MFGIEAINVVIGLIFIYLLFSLFVSLINEIISNLFNARGNQLYKSLKDLIGEDAVKNLYNDPRINILIKPGSTISSLKTEFTEIKNEKLPDFIPGEIFGEVLENFDNDKIKGKLEKATVTLKQSRKELSNLYELAITETRATYRKNVRNLTLVIGLVVTVSFNVDSIKVFKELANDPQKAAFITAQAEAYIAANDSLVQQNDAEIMELKEDLNELYKTQINSLNSTLGLGWDSEVDILDQVSLLGILGWVITVLALSLGAPFWFDLLKRVINIKNEITKK